MVPVMQCRPLSPALPYPLPCVPVPCPLLPSISVPPSQTDQLTIPISAALPKSHIIFAGHLDLGMVVRDSSAFGTVVLETEGDRPGKFELEWDPNLPIKMTPKTGVLSEAGAPDAAVAIKVEFFGGDLGVFRALAQVQHGHGKGVGRAWGMFHGGWAPHHALTTILTMPSPLSSPCPRHYPRHALTMPFPPHAPMPFRALPTHVFHAGEAGAPGGAGLGHLCHCGGPAGECSDHNAPLAR